MNIKYAALLALCLLPACDSKQGDDVPSAQNAQAPVDWTWNQSNAGQYWAAWKPATGPVEMGPSFAIEIKLSTTEAGAPLDLQAGQIDIQARMPEHQHGMLQSPEITRLSPGHYRVDGMRFHMLGYWQLQLDISRPPLTERAQFDIQL